MDFLLNVNVIYDTRVGSDKSGFISWFNWIINSQMFMKSAECRQTCRENFVSEILALKYDRKKTEHQAWVNKRKSMLVANEPR